MIAPMDRVLNPQDGPVNYGTTTLTADCGGFTAQCTGTVVRPEE